MKPSSQPSRKLKTFDSFLAALRPDQRAALEKLRKTIRAAAPKVEECISYGIPAFRLNGKFFVGIGAKSKHCAFYLGSTIRAHKDKLRKYDLSKGTIRFQPNDPLPAVLVRKLIKARLADRGPV